jgi:peptide/nickel transport system substrate-binding protein
MAHVQRHSHPCLKILLSVSLFISASLLLWQPTVTAQGRGGVLRIGMTASDIPNTAGQPDQGGEGLRFVGYQMYDALVNWDLRQGDRPAELMPGLAERWEVRPDDPTKWIFYLRHRPRGTVQGTPQ